MSIRCRKFTSAMRNPEPPPTQQQILNAKTWVKNSVLISTGKSRPFYIGVLVPYRMQRVLNLWAYNAIPTHKGGDVIFDKQDFQHNRHWGQDKSKLWSTCLEEWLNWRIADRVKKGHTWLAVARELGRIDKEIDYTLGMISREKNQYPTRGGKLMYEVVVELSKMTNSVYNYYAPNIK